MEILNPILGATVVVKAVIIVLLSMSILSWALIIFKFFSLKAAHKQTIENLKSFGEADNLKAAVGNINNSTYSPPYHVAKLGIEEYSRLKELGNSAAVILENVRRSLHQGVNEVGSALGASTSFLATCSNTAPFIGLFGTVWGIMHSFHGIAIEGKASIATVAPGISEALIATALGLFVAIPATMAYNSFLNRLNLIENELSNFTGIFLNRLQSELDNR